VTTAKRNAWWLTLAGLAVSAASLAGPRIVPLYDGVGFPDEPYRYVSRPSATPPASAAVQTIPLYGLDDSVFSVVSEEGGPQVSINLSSRALSVPKPATEVVLRADPKAPTDQPAGGTIAGNVYVVSATSQPGPPSIRNQDVSLSLRLPQDVQTTIPPKIIYRTHGGKWRALNTLQVGADIYEVHFQGVG
jgi:hypothetical protein